MRTIIKKIKAFNFNELKPEIQEKVLDNHREINTEFDFYDDKDFLIEDLLNKYGLSAENIYYDIYNNYAYFNNITIQDESLFYKALELNKYLCACSLQDEEVYFDIGFGDNEIKNFSKIQINSYEEDFSEQEQEIEKSLNEFIQDLNKDLLKRLRDNYEYQISDEAIKETIEINEYEFDEDGKII